MTKCLLYCLRLQRPVLCSCLALGKDHSSLHFQGEMTQGTLWRSCLQRSCTPGANACPSKWAFDTCLLPLHFHNKISAYLFWHLCTIPVGRASAISAWPPQFVYSKVKQGGPRAVSPQLFSRAVYEQRNGSSICLLVQTRLFLFFMTEPQDAELTAMSLKSESFTTLLM